MSSARPLNAKRSVRAVVWEACAGKCHHCGEAMDPFVNFQLDHLIPIALGGPDTVENLVGSCAACNLKRAGEATKESRRIAKESRAETDSRGMDAERLRAERKRLGLTQQQLADLLDVRQRTISEWEREEVTIRHQQILALALEAIASRMGVEPKELGDG